MYILQQMHTQLKMLLISHTTINCFEINYFSILNFISKIFIAQHNNDNCPLTCYIHLLYNLHIKLRGIIVKKKYESFKILFMQRSKQCVNN